MLIHMENAINSLPIVPQWTLTANAHNVNGDTISTAIKNVSHFHLIVTRQIHMENVQNVNQAILLMRMENALLFLFLQTVSLLILTTNVLNVNGVISPHLKANA